MLLQNQKLTEDDWLKIGREYNAKGPAKLSKELGVSRQRIYQVAQELRKNGAPIAKLRGLGEKIAKILIEENKNMKYQYKIIKNELEFPKEATEWRYVGMINNGLLFEKVIQEDPNPYKDAPSSNPK